MQSERLVWLTEICWIFNAKSTATTEKREYRDEMLWYDIYQGFSSVYSLFSDIFLQNITDPYSLKWSKGLWSHVGLHIPGQIIFFYILDGILIPITWKICRAKRLVWLTEICWIFNAESTATTEKREYRDEMLWYDIYHGISSVYSLCSDIFLKNITYLFLERVRRFVISYRCIGQIT